MMFLYFLFACRVFYLTWSVCVSVVKTPCLSRRCRSFKITFSVQKLTFTEVCKCNTENSEAHFNWESFSDILTMFLYCIFLHCFAFLFRLLLLKLSSLIKGFFESVIIVFLIIIIFFFKSSSSSLLLLHFIQTFSSIRGRVHWLQTEIFITLLPVHVTS